MLLAGGVETVVADGVTAGSLIGCILTSLLLGEPVVDPGNELTVDALGPDEFENAGGWNPEASEPKVNGIAQGMNRGA